MTPDYPPVADWQGQLSRLFIVAQIVAGDTPPPEVQFAMNDGLVRIVEGAATLRYEATEKGLAALASFAMSAIKQHWEIPF